MFNPKKNKIKNNTNFVKKGKNNSIVIFNINNTMLNSIIIGINFINITKDKNCKNKATRNLLLNYNKMNTKKNILIH